MLVQFFSYFFVLPSLFTSFLLLNSFQCDRKHRSSLEQPGYFNLLLASLRRILDGVADIRIPDRSEQSYRNVVFLGDAELARQGAFL